MSPATRHHIFTAFSVVGLCLAALLVPLALFYVNPDLDFDFLFRTFTGSGS